MKWQSDLGDTVSVADWENKFETVSASLARITGADLISGSASAVVSEPSTLLLGVLTAVDRCLVALTLASERLKLIHR